LLLTLGWARLVWVAMPAWQVQLVSISQLVEQLHSCVASKRLACRCFEGHFVYSCTASSTPHLSDGHPEDQSACHHSSGWHLLQNALSHDSDVMYALLQVVGTGTAVPPVAACLLFTLD
jgi:hypothetical protein